MPAPPPHTRARGVGGTPPYTTNLVVWQAVWLIKPRLNTVDTRTIGSRHFGTWNFFPLFFNLISSFTIYIVVFNLSSTLGANLDILEDKNCKKGDKYSQRGDKKVRKFDPLVL